MSVLLRSDVLISYGLKVARNTSKVFPSADHGELTELFGQYIFHAVDTDSALQLCKKILRTDFPIRKLAYIMSLIDSDQLPNLSSLRPSNQTKTKIKWKPQEDERLLGAVAKYGFENWRAIAAFVGSGRSLAQCRQRWRRTVDPKLSKELWSREEDELLLDTVDTKQITKWSEVAERFPDRCDTQCRHRYIVIKRGIGFSPNISLVGELKADIGEIFFHDEVCFPLPENSTDTPPMDSYESVPNPEFSFDDSDFNLF
jgi:hypothetical protein